MLLAYVDESYDQSLYWIGALLCPERVVAPLIAALDAVCEKAADSYGVSPLAELHGHDLFHAKGDWELLHLLTRARIGVYDDALEAIASFDVDIILRGVNVPGLNNRYVHPDHPHSVVLSHLLERIDERAEQQHEDQPVLVIADEVDQADTYRRSMWHFQRFATQGYRARRLTHIVDTIYFAPSRSSRLVQAADLIAFLHRRICDRAGRWEKADRANAALWDRVAHRVVHKHCWYP